MVPMHDICEEATQGYDVSEAAVRDHPQSRFVSH